MIPYIVSREVMQDRLNILWTHCDNMLFREFIKKLDDNCNLLEFDQTYFGSSDIDIVICNNRITHLNKCIEASRYFHCGLLIIDHFPKPTEIQKDKTYVFDTNPVVCVAMSENIASSWGNKHDKIMTCSLGNDESVKSWKELLYQLKHCIFTMKEVPV